MLELKPSARIGKATIIKAFDDYTTKTKSNLLTIKPDCSNCNRNSLFSDFIDETNDCCNECKEQQEKVFYHVIEDETPSLKFDIITKSPKKIRLSKSAIKQYLLYHFIPADKMLCRKAIRISNIASLCNISIPTARKNHATLCELGLVYSRKVAFGKMDIVIRDEYKNHLKKREGGSGYITLSLDSLKHLFEFECINELKLEIKKMLWVDARKGSLGKNVRFNKDNLLSVLPKYLHKSKTLLHKKLNSTKTLFELSDDTINTSNYIPKHKVRTKLLKSYIEIIQKFYMEANMRVSSNSSSIFTVFNKLHPTLVHEKRKLLDSLKVTEAVHINSIAELAIQYGCNRVLDALIFIQKHHTTIDEHTNVLLTDIKNPQAFIRKFIMRKINDVGSLYTT